ncbi:fungal-specific transcription factor domain-containing protein [Mycena floridula]|nr:fungal-specific transcription factor domain-containing protein [Mycena floridula]
MVWAKPSESVTPSFLIAQQRLQGSCDICRHKKSTSNYLFVEFSLQLTVKCDRIIQSDNICTNCRAFGAKCTYLLATQVSGNTPIRPKDLDPYLRTIQKPSQILGLDAYASIRSKVYSNLADEKNPEELVFEFANYIRVLEARLALKATTSSNPGPAPDSPGATDLDITENYLDRFYGESAVITLLKMTFRKGFEYDSESLDMQWDKSARPDMWIMREWEKPHYSRPALVFPDPDLMVTLIDAYFANVNILHPLLHRNTFERAVWAGLHLRDYYFGATLLTVCALGSRYCNDGRVFVRGVNTEHSCGWPWFVPPMQDTAFGSPPTLYQLQYYILCTLFLFGTSTNEVAWTVMGLCIRLSEEIGLHRKLPGDLSAEGELRKRALWVLFCVETLICALSGRPRMLRSDYIDQDLPAECDDIYWAQDESRPSFIQPPGQPSTLALFISYIKLMQVLEQAQSTLYSAKPASAQAINKIHESLNHWRHSQIPDHLQRESPDLKKNRTFSNQSSYLHIAFFEIRILVHQPGLLTRHLSVCVDAAKAVHQYRSTIHSRFHPNSLDPCQFAALFDSAAILIIHAVENSSDSATDMVYIDQVFDIFRRFEKRTQVAGKYLDTLLDLLPLSFQKQPTTTNPLDQPLTTQGTGRTPTVAELRMIAFYAAKSNG